MVTVRNIFSHLSHYLPTLRHDSWSRNQRKRKTFVSAILRLAQCHIHKVSTQISQEEKDFIFQQRQHSTVLHYSEHREDWGSMVAPAIHKIRFALCSSNRILLNMIPMGIFFLTQWHDIWKYKDFLWFIRTLKRYFQVKDFKKALSEYNKISLFNDRKYDWTRNVYTDYSISCVSNLLCQGHLRMQSTSSYKV